MNKNKKQPTRTGSSLSWEEREEMIKEYLQGDSTKTEIWRKYTGQLEEHGQILRWMCKLGYFENKKPPRRIQQLVMPQQQNSSSLSISSNQVNGEQIDERVKKLEKQLELAQLKVEGYELMIQIAEKEFKIPIIKKSDTK